MYQICIVVVYNDKALVDQLNNSLKDTNVLYKLYAIDNTAGKFKSAASAFNYALKEKIVRSAEVLIFCHQDIIFKKNSLEVIYSICKENHQILIGAAGVENKGSHSQIISSMSLEKEGWKYRTLIEGTIKDVFTLDECLIACHRDVLEKVQFDSEVCNGWHLYVADLCIQCQIKGIKVAVFDADIVHLSHGNTDNDFYICERKLAKKWRKDFRKISYSCGWTYTNPILYWMLHIYRKVKFGI